jgi:hypothetical protein
MLAAAGQLSWQTVRISIDEDYSPVNISEPLPNVFVFDFGQNMAGFTTLKAMGPSGDRCGAGIVYSALMICFDFRCIGGAQLRGDFAP